MKTITDQNTIHKLNNIAAVIASLAMSRLNIMVKRTDPAEYRESRSGAMFFEQEIDQDLGVFHATFKSAHLSHSVNSTTLENGKPGYSVSTGLGWASHGGGSNGKHVATIWLDERFNLVEMITEQERAR